MNRIYIALISLLLIYCSEKNESSMLQIPNRVLDLESHQLVELIKENPGVLLDVRTPNEVSSGHLENASFIDFYDEDFLVKASWIKKEQPIYVYCHSGGRSTKAASQLISLGFSEVYNLIGGYSKWKDNDLPIDEGNHNNKTKFKTYSEETLKIKIDQSEDVILVFKTPWCLPCKRLDPVLDSFKLLNPSWDVVVINMDNNKDVANLYEVASVPTLLIFKNKNLIFKETGYVNHEYLMEKALK